MLNEIDIAKKYSDAGHSLDMFEVTHNHLTDTTEAIQDALKKTDFWDFNIAYSPVELKIRLALIK